MFTKQKRIQNRTRRTQHDSFRVEALERRLMLAGVIPVLAGMVVAVWVIVVVGVRVTQISDDFVRTAAPGPLALEARPGAW